jgi:hypothetical protein
MKYSSGKDDDSGKKETPAKKPKYEYNYKDSEAEAQAMTHVTCSIVLPAWL